MKEPLQSFLVKDRCECGVDEAGRGALAGPVVAAAVIWPASECHGLARDIRDSKKLSKHKRSQLAEYIKSAATAYAISFIDNRRIDEVNILNATYEAMHTAIAGLAIRPDHILVDGNRFRSYADIAHTCIVKGDDKVISIAAASILAKVARDEYMSSLSTSAKYAAYEWAKNSGYGTSRHLAALQTHGPSDLHRMTFAPIRPTTLPFLTVNANDSGAMQDVVER
jgi:ribonuclease HII